MKVKWILPWGVSFSLLISGAAVAQPPSPTDAKFVMAAIQGDLSEVKMGQLAQQKGQSAETKQYGRMLERDHGAHLEKLTALAQQLGVTPPTEPTAKQKATYDELGKASPSNFDKQFAQAMVADHKEDIAKYQNQAKGSGPTADLAKETVPTLQTHLQHAEALAGKKPSPS
jgi:putative membrane protein